MFAYARRPLQIKALFAGAVFATFEYERGK